MKIIIKIFILLLALQGAAWGDGLELIINGNMELDSDWSDYGTPTTNIRSSEQVHGGTYSRKIVCDGADEGLKSLNSFSLTSGTLYRFTIWIYGNGTNSIYIRAWDGGAYHYALPYDGIIPPATWTCYVGYFYSSTTSADARIEVLSYGSAATFYIDDVSIKSIDSPLSLYIASAGDDTAAGTQAAPWATIAKLNNTVLPAGASVYLNRGNTWAERYTMRGTGTSGNIISVLPYGSGSDPILNGVTISGKNYLSFTSIASNDSASYGWALINVTNATLNSCSATGNSNHGVFIQSTAAGKGTITISGGNYSSNLNGILTDGYASGRLSDVTVQNITASNNLGAGIYFHRTDTVLIQNNVIDSNGDAIDASEDYGIAIASCTDATIKRNVISNTINNDAFQLYSDDTAEYGSANNLILHGNTISTTSAIGDCVGIGVVGNETATGMLIKYNVLTGCGGNGIRFHHSGAGSPASINVYQNTITGNTDSAIETQTANFPVVIRNNIFLSNGAPEVDFNLSTSGLTTSNNVWYRSSGNVLSYNSATYTTANIATFEATAIASNPLLNSSYGLQDNSPAKDAGIAIAGIHSGSSITGGDAAGNARLYGNGIDIGAYEKRIIAGGPLVLTQKGLFLLESHKFYTIP